METLTEIFSHICGQGRCYFADGVALPVCQRCLGLYVAAAMTGIWVFAAGIWRRGLPTRSISIINAAMLITAMLGGIHLIDPGPTWRLMCGLWTGHVAMLWLVGGAGHLWRITRGTAEEELPWRLGDRIIAFAAAPLLAALSVVMAQLAHSGWYFWTTIVIAGVVFLLIALTVAIVAVAACALITCFGGRCRRRIECRRLT